MRRLTASAVSARKSRRAQHDQLALDGTGCAVKPTQDDDVWGSPSPLGSSLPIIAALPPFDSAVPDEIDCRSLALSITSRRLSGDVVPGRTDHAAPTYLASTED